MTYLQEVSAVGVTTGAEYRIVGARVHQFTGSRTNYRFETTFINTCPIVEPEPGDNFLLHDVFHVTVTPEAEFAAVHHEFRASCQ